MARSPRTALAAAVASSTLILATGLAGCTDPSGSTEAFCAQVKRVPALESVLARFSEADTDLLDDRIAKAREAYDQLAEDAPEEIAEETEQVVGLVNDILDAVEEHPTDPAKASSQLRKAMAEHQGVDADRAKVAAFAQKECDVQLDPTLTDGAGASSTTTVGGGTSTTSVTGTDPGTADPDATDPDTTDPTEPSVGETGTGTSTTGG